MSSKFIVKSFITLSLGLIFGYTSVYLFNQSQTSENLDRNVASLPILKMGADQISRDYYDIKIKNDFVAEKNSETSIIKVTITVKKIYQ